MFTEIDTFTRRRMSAEGNSLESVKEALLKDIRANETGGYNKPIMKITSSALALEVHGRDQTLGGYLYTSYTITSDDLEVNRALDNSMTYRWSKERPSYPTISKLDLAKILHVAKVGTVVYVDFSGNDSFTESYIKAKHGWILVETYHERDARFESEYPTLTSGVRTRIAEKCGLGLSSQFHAAFDIVVNDVAINW